LWIVYSLGVIIQEMLKLQKPEKLSKEAIHLDSDNEPESKSNVYNQLSQLCGSCTQKEPNERPTLKVVNNTLKQIFALMPRLAKHGKTILF